MNHFFVFVWYQPLLPAFDGVFKLEWQAKVLTVNPDADCSIQVGDPHSTALMLTVNCVSTPERYVGAPKGRKCIFQRLSYSWIYRSMTWKQIQWLIIYHPFRDVSSSKASKNIIPHIRADESTWLTPYLHRLHRHLEVLCLHRSCCLHSATSL